MSDEKIAVEGVLDFHSETGTEGGYWAFQDKCFIEPNTTRFSCVKCHAYWYKARMEKPHVDTLPTGGAALYCAPGTHDFQLVSKENWSNDGLKILEDGDTLMIFSKRDPQQLLWEGVIRLRTYPPFTEHVGGFWIHQDQIGVVRETWALLFFENYPARLIKK